MRRFFAEPERCKGSHIELAEDESRHLAQVLRAQVGEQVTILDGAGGVYDCRIERVTKRNVHLTVEKRERLDPFPYEITLFQAIPKGKVMEWIVQKATELGARRIVPLVTERTVVEIHSDSTKIDKWRAIAIESIKQCGSPYLPKIDAPIEFSKALRQVSGLPFVAALRPGAGEINEYFGRDRRPVQIWIGPEGDFTSEEVDKLEAAGVHPITLGPLVLRCDTAAVSALTLAAHQLRSLQSE
ncbi:MAG TPA: 16S rRNA (uracil(1498)-N(3))-methyltransferase [Verrucomicrobiae bacterium]|nr:16S rRNA (uracil(1498)-N(3))-methyltransferase [Verrucomicrobiae bacterium]